MTKISNYVRPGAAPTNSPGTPGNSAPVAATNVTYDNGTSGLAATNAQDAIDELDATVDGLAAPSLALDDLTDVDTTGVANGDTIIYDLASTTWLVGAAAGGTPASTVTDETTWGISPAVGTDTEYARQDHTHGTPADPGAAPGASVPGFVQYKFNGVGATSVVLDSAPVNGHSLIMLTDSTTGQVTGVASTNTTWTQLVTFGPSSGSSYYAIWVGVVGAAASATITMTKPGTYNSVTVIETTQTLTPTLGNSVTTSPAAAVTTIAKLASTTSNRLFAFGVGQDNTTVAGQVYCSAPVFGVFNGILELVLGFGTGSDVYVESFSAGAGGLIACEIS